MRTPIPALVLLMAAGAGAGCSLITRPDIGRLYPETDGSRPDGAVPPDADAGPMPDAAPPWDGDAPPGPDAGPDVDAHLPPDGGPPPEDGGTASPPGCADGTVEQPYPGRSDIVGCDGAVSQCAAYALCAPGWHLCGWDEFQRRGAMVTATTVRWIAACARAGCSLDPMRVQDGTCGDCTSGEAMLPMAVSFACMGALPPREEIMCDVGVAAFTDPMGRRVGSTTTPCMRAEAFPTRNGYGATCCR